MVDLSQFDPVMIDLETRSCCDLKAAGGHKYALDPSTNLLTVSWSPRPDENHVWFPALAVVALDPSYVATHLDGVIVHYGKDVPDELRNVCERPWCAHNAWTFDEHVWRAIAPDCQPVDWLDTYPLALAAGLPGSLDRIAQRLWGEGKYEGGTIELKKQMMPKDRSLASAENVPLGSQVLIGRYNVQDVKLLRWLWDELCRTLRMPHTEWEVMQNSRRCNDRGVRVDKELIRALVEYTHECQGRALARIRELTAGDKTKLQTDKDLRSRTKIFAWLSEKGVAFGTSLRRELVQKFVEIYGATEDEDPPEEDACDDDGSENNPNLATVVEVLLLRMSALKITNAKLSAALGAVDSESVIRALHAYWGAHTGRDAHRRVQVGNLPKAKDGVKPWNILQVFDQTGSLPYDRVTETMPLGKPGYRFLMPDDAASGVLRSVFVHMPTDAALGVADLSTIEARVIAWLAGEQWLLDAFRNDVDPYLALAYKLFGPYESWNNPGKLPAKKHPYRQTCKIILLGSLYQLGKVKMGVFGTASGIDWDAIGITPAAAIHAFRGMHPAIAGPVAGEYKGEPYYRGGFWDKLDWAAKAAIAGHPTPVGKILFERIGAHLYMVLPSGRAICYRHAGLGKKEMFGKEKDIWFFHSGRYGRVDMYGGKAAENATQGTARDFMMHSGGWMERDDIPVYIRVHDEIAAGLRHERRFPRFMQLMTTPPLWAPDFTLDAEGARMPRYSKSPPPGSTDAVWRNGQFYKQDCPKCGSTCKGKPECSNCGWGDEYGI